MKTWPPKTLLEALKVLQTGSCDGCGSPQLDKPAERGIHYGYCPVCGVESTWNENYTELQPPKHIDSCWLGQLLKANST